MNNITHTQLNEVNYSSTAFHCVLNEEAKTVTYEPFPAACVELFQGNNHAWGLLPDCRFFGTNEYYDASELEGSVESYECGESAGEPFDAYMGDGSYIAKLVKAKWGEYEGFINDAVRGDFGDACADALLDILKDA